MKKLALILPFAASAALMSPLPLNAQPAKPQPVAQEKTPQEIIDEDFAALPPVVMVFDPVPYTECNGGPCPFMTATDDGTIVNSDKPLKLQPKEWSAMAQVPDFVPVPRPRPQHAPK